MLVRLVGGAEPWSLLPLRIVVGVVFLVHGGQKLLCSASLGSRDTWASWESSRR
jgi:uncharacterized membrane protein YphA (DoxX/SURF4 family)